MPAAKKTIAFRLERPEQYRLQAEAAERGITISELVRDLIHNFLRAGPGGRS